GGVAKDEDSDIEYDVSKHGTVVEYDTDDEQDLTLTYPEDDAKADVFVGPTSSMVETGGGEDGVVTEEVQKIGSQVTKFDTEVSDATSQDLISIGGPCANSVTSALMGNPEDCSEGFESGMALLKLVENGDNTALVVAGGTGKDTRVASTVLQNYEEYSEELSGSELKLTTVSESNIGFESVE
ncbi:MAG: S-layer protein, partial [Nanobdellota archaeon]